MDAYREGATGNSILEKTRQMKKSHRVPLMIDQQPRVGYDRNRGRRIVSDIERNEREGDERGDKEGDEIVFDPDTFARKLRQVIYRSGRPAIRLVKLGNDLRDRVREAPRADLLNWEHGKVFFDEIVQKQREDEALIERAHEELAWRAVWNEAERAEEWDCITNIYVIGVTA